MLQRLKRRVWSRLGSPDSGQDLLEYALLVALIAMVAVTVITQTGTTIKTVFWDAIATTTGSL
jgi:Flp pilus assembly pilin Flp